MTRWLVCDYGNVLSLAQPEADVLRLADLAGLPVEEFTERYWATRLAYDRADLDAASYWASVLGGAAQPEQLNALVAADIASWVHLNEETLAAAGRAAGRGYRLALLSNAPVEVARAVERLEQLRRFQPRWFSCDLRLTKPDVAVYTHILGALAAPAAAVTFLDDRPDNVDAARAVGLRAEIFQHASQIDDL